MNDDRCTQNNVTHQRERFEEWVSEPPFEYLSARQPKNWDFAWPGQYTHISVQLAWKAWCTALGLEAVMDENCTWIETPEYWECDACGLSWVFADGGPAENEMRYCPGCGRRLLDESAPTNNQENE